jgi:hypothetical protein
VLILRATQKVLKLLPKTARDEDVSDSALGDWYVNRIVIDRQPLLLCVSSKSLLAMVMLARDIKALPERFPDLVAERLVRLGVDAFLITHELKAMQTVRVGRTLDRSIRGTMTEFAKFLPLLIRRHDMARKGYYSATEVPVV